MGLIVLVVSVAILSFFLGVVSVFWWLVPKIENRFVFRPDRRIFQTPADRGVPFERVFFEASDGPRLSAWHLCPTKPRAAILYFHGNSGNLGLFTEVFQLLYQHRLQVFAVDYRGYGQSTGDPSEDGLHRDALAAIEYFNQHFRIQSVPLIYWGRSLGCCVAAFAASQEAPDGLVLESGFPSKKHLLKYFPQFRAFRIFSKCRLDTARYLHNQPYPVLVVHGDKDQTIPFEQGRRLYDSLTGRKEFYHVEGADHINTHRLDSKAYMERILNFVEQSRRELVH